MSDFDPSAYLAEKQASAAPASFDPATYLAEKTTPVPAKGEGIDFSPRGSAQAVMRGAAQGASLGFADEATAGVGGLYDYAMGKIGQRGDISLSDAYHTRRDAIRRADAAAQASHPWLYGGGEAAGSLATAFAPGLGALNVSKGAGLAEAAGKGALLGSAAGAGGAKEITDVPAEALRGAEIGGVLGGTVHLGGKAASAVLDKLKPAKVGSVLLNAPESALQRYIDNPDAVNVARPREEIVQETFLPRLEALKSDVTGGSAASRQVLEKEGKTVSGNQVADLFDSKAQELMQRSEGTFDDPTKGAAYKWLKDTANLYRGQNGYDQAFTTNRLKDLVQTLDQKTTYEVGPGRFADIHDATRQDIRRGLDQMLKGESPAYTTQMKKVAADTALLNQVSDLARTPQSFDALLKRTQRGTAPHQLKTLQAFDQRTGGGLLDELENSAVKDALAKGAMNGSRNELLHGGIGDALGSAVGGLPGRVIGRSLGLLGGASVDKYGPAIAKRAVDTMANVQSLLNSSEGLQALGRYAQPLTEAAVNGNRALAATNAYLLATDPNYGRIVDPNGPKRDAIRRRLGE